MESQRHRLRFGPRPTALPAITARPCSPRTVPTSCCRWKSSRRQVDLSRGGMIGVGTWATQAEFKDIRVTKGTRRSSRAISEGPEALDTDAAGTWEVHDGALRQTGMRRRLPGGNRQWQMDRLYLSLKARKLGGEEGFLIMFALRDSRTQDAGGTWAAGGTANMASKATASTAHGCRARSKPAAGTTSASTCKAPGFAAISTAS